ISPILRLTATLYFCTYRTMERERRAADENPSGYKRGTNIVELERVSSTYSVLTDAPLTELKRQAQDGCVLCSLDSLDEDEWD
ncbi:MAG TPA: hypothetical protein VHZ55_31705, partial [Bryobacteraceae bacterium]|nr:hypothetical protein [Bryobacteraceae bacterium]